MKIIVEDKIPYIKGTFDDVAEVKYLPANEIVAENVKDADVLITRTRPRIDSSLLEGSNIRLVATATIGTDHIDLEYCRAVGIKVVNAPGCNAPGVAQWVFSSIFSLMENKPTHSLTIGIVGVGNVGKIVEKWGRDLGFRVLLNDPPRALKEGADNFVDIDTIAKESDIITFHTPLVKTGRFPTYHIGDNVFFSKLRHKPLVLNAARGSILDTEATINAIDGQRIGGLSIDCWEGEPEIDCRLLERTSISTPHIAGYSMEGKKRATAAAVKAVTEEFGLEPKWQFEIPPLPTGTAEKALITGSYDVRVDSAPLKSHPEQFEKIRNNYCFRPEPRFL